ncbi:MAG: DUF4139 domain-containing protein [Myxococcota bacterium]
MRRWTLSLALLSASPSFADHAGAAPRHVESGLGTRMELNVTAYRTGRQDTAFLREVREIEIPAGEVKIALRGVPDTVQRETVSIRVVDGPPVEVLEQTFSYDLMTPSALMRAAEGTDITVEVEGVHDGKLHPVRVHVVASQEEPVLRTPEGYTFGLHAERKRFAKVPERLTPRPTLTWHARSPSSGKRKVEISYLLTGLRWSADYVAVLARTGRQVDLSGWVTFNNDTAGRFEDAHLAVAAGTIHRVSRRGRVITLSSLALESAGYADREPAREALGHLHLYKISQRTNLEPNSIKNVRLLTLDDVPVKRTWVTGFHVHPSRNATTRTQHPTLRLEMRNDEDANAGVPIPAGKVRVMIPDRRGTPHLVASTTVEDTPKGEPLKIDMGSVAEVKAKLVPKDYRTSLIGAKEGIYALELRNASRHAGTMRVDLQAGPHTTLQIPGAKMERPSAATWRIEVPLGPGATRNFRVVATLERPGRSSR